MLTLLVKRSLYSIQLVTMERPTYELSDLLKSVHRAVNIDLTHIVTSLRDISRETGQVNVVVHFIFSLP